MDELTKNVRKWFDEPSTYKPEEMRACLDSWREALFSHLDQEVRPSGFVALTSGQFIVQVKDLSAESMKKYWTLEEVDRIAI